MVYKMCLLVISNKLFCLCLVIPNKLVCQGSSLSIVVSQLIPVHFSSSHIFLAILQLDLTQPFCPLKLLEAGKMVKCKDLIEFDNGQIVMLDNCVKSSPKIAVLGVFFSLHCLVSIKIGQGRNTFKLMTGSMVAKLH